MRTVSAVLLVLLLASFGQAQQNWTKTYGGPEANIGEAVRQTSDGGYIATGWTTSSGGHDTAVYLIKTKDTGDTLWTRTYGGSGGDFGYSVQQTSDGGFIVAGYTNSFGADSNDVYLIKTNASGDTLWTRTYGGTGDDEGYSVQQTSDRGYIIAGYTWAAGLREYDFYLVKTDSFGDTLWTRTYGGNGDDYGYSVQQTSDGGYIVAGSTSSFGAGEDDAYLVKTNASGDTVWTRTYGGSSVEYVYSVQQTSDGGYVVAGSTNSYGAGRDDVYLVKTRASGDTAWTRTYGGSSSDGGYCVQQTSDRGYIVTGYTSSFGAGVEDVYLVKTDSLGDTLWTRTWGTTGDDWSTSVRQTSDGGYIVAGTTSSETDWCDVWLIKTDANGHAGVAEPAVSREMRGATRIVAVPNPFVSSTRIPGHDGDRFEVYDASGKMVGAYRGNRIGEGLLPAVYFIRSGDERGGSLRVVKAR
ncbi:MAG TPA: hypothetical protein VMH22_12135 [bacterium]|nr:hypothetical protein [bacterium]